MNDVSFASLSRVLIRIDFLLAIIIFGLLAIIRLSYSVTASDHN